MILHSKKWRGDEGSIDFVQLVVGLMIIGIAAVGTFQALFYGYQHLDTEMRYKKASSIARSYLEYWQGRIHVDFDTKDIPTRAGNLGRPERVLLDRRNPNVNYDDVYCYVSYAPLSLEPFDRNDALMGGYWPIVVYLQWWEPYDSPNRPPREITFFGSMVPADI